jgi:glycine cleavage system H lipoate-binding protein
MVKVQPEDEGEIEVLMTAEEYAAYLQTLE